MKQVWYILTLDVILMKVIHVSQRFETEYEANAWLLEIAQEERVYSVKPFEVFRKPNQVLQPWMFGQLLWTRGLPDLINPCL